MSGHRRKSRLARTLDYWTRQTGRVAKLLIVIFIVILIIIALVWLIPILIENIQNMFV